MFQQHEVHFSLVGAFALACLSPASLGAPVGDLFDEAQLTANAGSGNVSVLIGSGDGSFAAPIALQAGFLPSAVASADMNGDFMADLAVANSFSGSVSIFTNLSGPWIDLGGAGAGAAGNASLLVSGTPSDDQLVSLLVDGLSRGYHHGWLVVGLERADTPFLGGVLVPHPLGIAAIEPGVNWSFRWPTGLPAGTSVYLQAWFDVSSVQAGPATGTNGLRAVAQSP
jgi:hypothetical protein